MSVRIAERLSALMDRLTNAFALAAEEFAEFGADQEAYGSVVLCVAMGTESRAFSENCTVA